MKNVILADILRVSKKKSFIIMLILECLLIIFLTVVMLAAIEAINKNPQITEKVPFDPMMTYMSMTVMSIGAVAPLLLGLPIFLAVFSDDFRSHAMQMAIGSGLSRTRLILARFIEVILLTIEVTVFMLISAFISGLIQNMPMDVIMETMWMSLQNLISMICYLALCLIPVYGMQSTTLAMVMYIIFSVGVPGTVLNAIRSGIPQLKDIHIEWILPEKLINDVALSGNYSWGWIVWIIVPVVFIIIPVWLATVIFKKKELEF